MTNPDQDLIDMIAKATPETPINDDHRERLRRQALEAYDERAADGALEAPRNPLFQIKGTTVMKLAASLALMTAIGIFAVTALTPTKTLAFEDVAREILKIENARFEIGSSITHADGTTEDEGTFKCVTKLPHLLRGEMPEGDIMIIDFAKDKMLVIDPKKKAALVMDEFLGFSEEDNLQKNLFGEIQEHLRNAEKGGDFGAIKYEQLGEQKIDGIQAVGFRVLNPDANTEDEDAEGLGFNTLDIWADAKTGRPVNLTFTLELEDGSRVTSTFKNFAYNQELDPELFSFEAPEGYELIDGTDLIRVGQVFGDEGEIGEGIAEAEMLADEIAAELEKELDKLGGDRPTTQDVIEALRAYTQQTGGQFPDTLTMAGMLDGMVKAWEQANPGKPLFVEDATDITFTDPQLIQNTAAFTKASAYLETLTALGGNYTYRGRGVNVTDQPRPVLWLQAKGAPGYTVIYNDFSVADTNRGPNAE
ncbi:MAG: LolA family protein [Phycisphaeraceae bacterium]